MTRSENEVDQIVFRWDSENLTGSTGFGPVAWSGPREEAENLFRTSGPMLRASGEETRPALIRLQRRSEVMLIHRTPFTDAVGRTSVLCHALVGSPELLEPATCLGLHAWNWEGAAMDGARVRGQLPVIPERVLVPATGRGQGELDNALEGVAEELTGMVAELLRHQDERFTVLDERGDTAGPVLWGLHSMFGALTGRRWTFATHDTVELTALRFVFVGRWSGAASRNTDRRRVDPRERFGDRAEETAARLVRHHLRGVVEGDGQEYAVGSALHGASSARGVSLLETAVRALDVLDRRHPGGYAPAPAPTGQASWPPAPVESSTPAPPAPDTRRTSGRRWGWGLGGRSGDDAPPPAGDARADRPGARDAEPAGGDPRGAGGPGPYESPDAWFRPDRPEPEPAAPADSRVPAVPADARAPVAPTDSRVPAVPADSRVPAAPADPGAPAVPTDARVPASPQDGPPARPPRRPDPSHPTHQPTPYDQPHRTPDPTPYDPPRPAPEPDAYRRSSQPDPEPDAYRSSHPAPEPDAYRRTSVDQQPAPPRPSHSAPKADPYGRSLQPDPEPDASRRPSVDQQPAPPHSTPEPAPARPPHPAPEPDPYGRDAVGRESRPAPSARPDRPAAPPAPEESRTADIPTHRRHDLSKGPVESGVRPTQAAGADEYPRPVLPLVAPAWTGPGAASGRAWAAVRGRGREREAETGLVHKLPAARTVDEARELVERGGNRELLDSLRRPQAYVVLTLLLREAARRLPSWEHPLRRELCEVAIGQEFWAVAPAGASADPSDPPEEQRAANAAEVHRWAVRPLLAGGDAPVGTVGELLARLRTSRVPSARETFWLIVDDERPGLPEAVWLTLLKDAYGLPRTARRPGPPAPGAVTGDPDDPGNGYTRRFLRRVGLLIGGLVVAILLLVAARVWFA
ncbi:hypothetical protein [Streptomyces sp. NPDC058548]|uniref:hypothetical protein n=1 Tax=Streptomyces sp. NPDC058548 TaxID=3346545 RepID=UPI00364A5CFC